MYFLYPTQINILGEECLVGENMNKEEESKKKKKLMKVGVFLALCLPFYLYSFLTSLLYTCSGVLCFAIYHIPLVIYVILVGERKGSNRYYFYIVLILFAIALINLIYSRCILFGVM